jgi:hypothetical protein
VEDIFVPSDSPARHGSMQEQLPAWELLLRNYPDPVFRRQMVGSIRHGVRIGYEGILTSADRRVGNLPIDSAGHAHIRREVEARLGEGRLSIIPDSAPLVESPIGVVPKPRSTKFRTIHHLSHPRHPRPNEPPSLNAGILPHFVKIYYESIQPLLSFVRGNPGCQLWKGDLQDAFHHIVTSTTDARLLGFSYEGVCYRENALTFGGRSYPWLFNLSAEFLHWIVESCLPATWPVNHYLDDFFGAVPADDDALLPLQALALAARCLGLTLSAAKTFGVVTRLEILGIEVDSVRLTVGLTDERRRRVIRNCEFLVSRRSADLLDLQRIAGLLQFVTQVLPHGRAYLRRLFDGVRAAHRWPGRRRLPQSTRAELTWWIQTLRAWDGSSIMAASPLIVEHVWTDACKRAYGAHWGLPSDPSGVFSRELPRRHRRKDIRFCEALAVLEALRLFSPSWHCPRHVVIHIDNEKIEHGLSVGAVA